MQALTALITAVIVVLFAGWMVVQFLEAARVKRWKTAVTAGGLVLTLIGMVGFFGMFLSVIGALDWLPRSFEWPVGRVTGVIELDEGVRAVPHTATNRVQLYDRDWRFLRGWRVDANGGVFTIQAGDNDTIEVFTARGQQHLVYNTLGEKIGTGDNWNSHPPFYGGGVTWVPTPWWLWTFTHPLYSWLTLAAGMLLIFLLNYRAMDAAAAQQLQHPLMKRLIGWARSQSQQKQGNDS